MNAAVPLPQKALDFPIFDADSHWTEPADLWTSRAPAKYKGKVMHVRRSRNGVDAWYLGETRVAALGPQVVRSDLSKQYEVFSLPNADEMTRAGTYARERLDLLDQLGVGTQVVYPNAIGFGASTMLRAGDDSELKLFHIQAYNDALADMQRQSGNRLLGQIVLPLWDIDAAITELHRGRKMGLTGISMNEHPADWHQPPLLDPVWERFWSTCQDLALPVNFHIGSGTVEAALSAPEYWGDHKMFLDDDMLKINGKFMSYQGTTLQIGNQTCILNLLVSGMLEKYPKLKFVSVESGLSWTPFVLQSLENMMREVMDRQTRSLFKRSPREAFRDQIYVTYWFEDQTSVEFYVKFIGADNVMFETDFPHPVSIFPGVQAAARDSTANLSEQDRRKILYQNAEKLYGVKIGSLRS